MARFTCRLDLWRIGACLAVLAGALPSSAHAGCGDHVSPSTHLTRPDAGHVPPPQPAPCTGPHCSRGSEDVPVAPPSVRAVGERGATLPAAVSLPPATPSSPSPPGPPDRPRGSLDDPLYRPPR